MKFFRRNFISFLITLLILGGIGAAALAVTDLGTTLTTEKVTVSGSATTTIVGDGTTTTIGGLLVVPNNNIGIGNSNPAVKLDVSGSIYGNTFYDKNNTSYLINPSGNSFLSGSLSVGTTTTSGALNIVGGSLDLNSNKLINLGTPTNSGDAATKSYVDSASGGDSRWTLSGSNLYASSTTWDVGIGTTTPDSKLHLEKDGATIKLTSASEPDVYWTEMTRKYGCDPGFKITGIFKGKDVIKTANCQDVIIGNSNGNVGIATTTPSSPLTVAGTIESTSGGIKFPDGTTQTTAGGGGGGNWKLSGSDLYASSTSWNVGIGTTTPGTYFGQQAILDINGYAAIGGLRIKGSDTANTIYQESNMGIVTGGSGKNITVEASGDVVLQGSNGNVGIGTNSPSERLQIESGDDSIAFFGPNSTWGGKMIVGAGQDSTDSVTAQAISTNGNLHLDAASGNTTYINHYNGSAVRIRDGAGADVAYFDNNGNVGIGDSSPSDKLEVNGIVRANQLTDRNNTSYYVNPSSNSRLAGQLRFGGDVGVIDEGSDWVNIGSNSFYDGSWKRLSGSKGGGNLHITDGKFHFRTVESDGSDGKNIAVIRDSDDGPSWLNGIGNFGIGTTNPSYTFDVSGEIRVDGSAGYLDNVSSHWVMDMANDFRIRDSGSSDLVRFKQNGNVGIGTTDPSSALEVAYAGGSGTSDPAEIHLHNTGSQGSSQIYFDENDEGGSGGALILRYRSKGDGSDNDLQVIDGSGTIEFEIDRGDGDVDTHANKIFNTANINFENNEKGTYDQDCDDSDSGRTGTGLIWYDRSDGGDPTFFVCGQGSVWEINTSSASSEEFKQDLQPMEVSVEDVLGLSPKSFEWRDKAVFEEEDDDGRDIGLIAEEVDKTLPELVTYKNGKPFGVEYDKLPVYLLEVIKKQDREISELRSLVCKDHPAAEVCN